MKMDGVGSDVLKKESFEDHLMSVDAPPTPSNAYLPLLNKRLSTQSEPPDDTTGGFTRHKNLLIEASDKDSNSHIFVFFIYVLLQREITCKLLEW